MLADAPVHFIFASPRSGTTWLANALNQHPQVLATEQRLFGNFCQVWPNPDGSYAARQTWDYFVRNFSAHYLPSLIGGAPATASPTPADTQSATATRPDASNETELLAQREALFQALLERLVSWGLQQSGKQVLVDKITPYLGTAGVVLKQLRHYFPQAKVLHLIRDGRDVATSGAFDWIQRGDPTSDQYRYYVNGEVASRPDRLFDDSLLEEWARYWKEPQAVIAYHAAQGDWANQLLEVRYEDMLEDQPRQLARVFEFLGIEHDMDLCRDAASAVTFEKTTGRKRGQAVATAKARKGVRGDWRNHFTRCDAEYFQTQCGHWLFHHGYEAGPDWVAECPPDLPHPQS